MSERDAAYVATVGKYIRAATVNFVDEGVMIDLKCETCGHKVAYASDTRTPPNRIALQLREEGWKLGANTDINACPEHYTKPSYYRKNKKEQHTMPDSAVQLRPAEDLLSAPPAPAAPALALVSEPTGETMHQKPKAITPTARAARAEATRWLMESYDERRNCYKAGYSDKSIATETGLAETAVADLRESIYGPMGAPIELIELTDKIGTLDDKIASARAKMEREIEAARTTGLAAIEAINTEVAAMRAAFEQIAKQQGWVE